MKDRVTVFFEPVEIETQRIIDASKLVQEDAKEIVASAGPMQSRPGQIQSSELFKLQYFAWALKTAAKAQMLEDKGVRCIECKNVCVAYCAGYDFSSGCERKTVLCKDCLAEKGHPQCCECHLFICGKCSSQRCGSNPKDHDRQGCGEHVCDNCANRDSIERECDCGNFYCETCSNITTLTCPGYNDEASECDEEIKVCSSCQDGGGGGASDEGPSEPISNLCYDCKEKYRKDNGFSDY